LASSFRVGPGRADEIIEEVSGAVRRWRSEAKAAGLSREEQERMARAFRIADRA
jgi:serine/threonine-protein kinase HipA